MSAIATIQTLPQPSRPISSTDQRRVVQALRDYLDSFTVSKVRFASAQPDYDQSHWLVLLRLLGGTTRREAEDAVDTNQHMDESQRVAILEMLANHDRAAFEIRDQVTRWQHRERIDRAISAVEGAIRRSPRPFDPSDSELILQGVPPVASAEPPASDVAEEPIDWDAIEPAPRPQDFPDLHPLLQIEAVAKAIIERAPASAKEVPDRSAFWKKYRSELTEKYQIGPQSEFIQIMKATLDEAIIRLNLDDQWRFAMSETELRTKCDLLFQYVGPARLLAGAQGSKVREKFSHAYQILGELRTTFETVRRLGVKPNGKKKTSAAAALTKTEKAIILLARDPNKSDREIAREVGCNHSLLSRDPRFQQARRAACGAIPRGRTQEGIIEADDE